MVERYSMTVQGPFDRDPPNLEPDNEGDYIRYSEYARLQEKVETLRKERDTEAAFAAVRAKYLKAAEAERDRLREGCRIYAASLRGSFSTRYEVAEGLEILAALQKEPKP